MSPLPASTSRRRLVRQGLCTLAAGSLPGLAGSAEAAGPAGPLLDERLALQGVGLVALQVEGGQVTLTARGRRQAGGEALSETDWFEVGSITKTFTALLLAQAVVSRRLALTDPVEAALPDRLPLRDSRGAPIRWIDLATHRAGLPRLPANMAPAMPADPYADYGETALLDFLRSHRITTPRDTAWAYSNLGYGLLGHALARAAGTRYPDLLQREVLGPLGLKEAALMGSGPDPSGLAKGHDAEGRPVPHWHFDVMAPAGGLVMSPAALARYAQAALGLVDNPLQEAFALTRQRHADGPAPVNPIGLAWLLAPLNGRTVLNHDGGTFGFSSSLWLDPSRGRATAVLGNAAVEVKDLALHLLAPEVPVKDLRATRQAAITLGPDELAPLVGTYRLNPSFALTIRVQEGRLFAQATGQQAFELSASAPRRFFARVTPLSIDFDEGPVPKTLTLVQQGQTLRFEREP